MMVVPKRRRPPASPSLCSMMTHHHLTDRHHHQDHHHQDRRHHLALLFVAILALSALVLLAIFVVVQPKQPSSITNSKSPLLRPAIHALVAPTSKYLSSDSMHDVIILGRGPSGLSAALFAARSGLSVLVLGSATGALSQAISLDNYPSWQQTTAAAAASSTPAHVVDESIGGPGWLQATTMQAERVGATFAPPGLLATNIESLQESGREQKLFMVHSQNSHSFKSRSVIIATGSSPRRMNLPNEDSLWGQALHSCAICDGSQYAGRTVLVVGGGDAALDAALILSRRSKLVYLLHRRDEWRAKDAANIQSVEGTDNIRIMRPYIVKKWVIDKDNNDAKRVLKSVIVGKVGNPGTTTSSGSSDIELSVDGVFTMIGSNPNSHFLRQSDVLLELSSDGHVVVDDKMMSTSHPGVFAAGEVADERYRQAIVAASDGAKAAIDAERWLRLTYGITTTSSSSGHQSAITDTTAATDESMASGGEGALAKGLDGAVRHQFDDRSEDKDDKDPEDCDLTTITCIETVVSRYPVVIFSKPWCPYCRRAIEALALDGVENPHIIDLSQMDAQRIQSILQQMTGRRTVPNVFIGGKTIGGGDETVALEQSGKLRAMLHSVGANS